MRAEGGLGNPRNDHEEVTRTSWPGNFSGFFVEAEEGPGSLK